MKSITISNGSDSFTFDNSLSGAVLKSFEGFEFPGVSANMQDLPSRQGMLYLESEFISRRISWQGELLGTSNLNMFTQRRNLLAALSQKQMVTINATTYDDLEIQTQGYISTLNMPYDKAVCAFLIEVICEDWRLYSQAEVSSSSAPTVTTSGVALPAALPISFSTTGGTPKLSLSNSGHEYTNPTIAIHGAGTNFLVQNQTNNESFNLNLTLTAGENVVVDTLAETVIQNGSTNVFGSFSGDFIKLEPGANTIHFNAASGTDASTLVEFTYRHAYRGV
jgi:hypothetical protein